MRRNTRPAEINRDQRHELLVREGGARAGARCAHRAARSLYIHRRLEAGRVVFVRPGLWLEEISLVHRVPPWKIDAGRARPRLLGRLGWTLRATAYRVGLRRLALIRLAESEA